MRKLKFHSNRTRIAVTLHGDQYTFLIISHSVHLIIRKILDKGYRENQSTCFTFKKFFFRKSRLYEIMWKNISEPGRPQMTIWHLRIACWITKARNTPIICYYIICNTYCFSTATVVALTRLIVMLYAHCLSYRNSLSKCPDRPMRRCD